jgi:hypothetical protein
MEVRVSALGKTVLSREMKNISMGGLFLIVGEKFPLSTDCQLTIILGGGESQARIETQSKVVRVTDEGMAFRFVEILGTESFNHLRNLVLYNAPDAQRLEEEIEKRLGDKPRK